jgi:hypothetical protein
MAGIVAAGAIGAALAVGGVAYAAADDPGTGNGEQIVRVVDQGDHDGDCPDKGQDTGENAGTGENL